MTAMIKVKIPSLKRQKRALLLFFKKAKGSMALEGSLVLPVFLFFMMTVLLGLEAVRFQSDVQQALHQTGNRIAFEGYSIKYSGGNRAGSGELVREYLDGQLYPYLCVAGGRDGVSVKEVSETEGNGQVEILAEYSLRPFIFWLPIGDIKVRDRFFSHLWVGYRGKEGQSSRVEEIFVYVTKTGTRYHLSYQCTYLGIQPEATSYEGIDFLRNTSGGKYYACQRCRPVKGGTVYITADGHAYHGKSDCSALKRNVYMIPLSQAESYGACHKCAG